MHRKNWLFNVASTYRVKSLSLIDVSDQTYDITLSSEHYLVVGDTIGITGGDGAEKTGTIISVNSATGFRVRGQGQLFETDSYTIKRKIVRASFKCFFISSEYFSKCSECLCK